MTKMMNPRSEQIRNGKWKEFNRRAVLVAEGFYLNNQKHGTWKEYNDFTGVILIEENFKQGIQHGRFVSYHPNGTMLSEGNFQNGSREGYFKIFDERGKCVKRLLFVNNIQIEELNEEEYTDEKAVQGQY